MRYEPLARRIALEYGLDPDIFLRQISVESGWNPNAVSPKGAQGLGQIMPDTQKELGISNPFDPEQSLRGAAQYMRKMLDDSDGNYRVALASYIQGPTGAKKPWVGETHEYVGKILTPEQNMAYATKQLGRPMDITGFRQMFPMYKDKSDEEIAQKTHKQFVPDMEYGAFRQKFGVTPGAWEQVKSIPGALAAGSTEPLAQQLKYGPVAQRAQDYRTAETQPGIPEGVSPTMFPSGPMAVAPMGVGLVELPGIKTQAQVDEAKERIQVPLQESPMWKAGQGLEIKSGAPSDIQAGNTFQIAKQIGRLPAQVGTYMANPALAVQQSVGGESVDMFQRGLAQGKDERTSVMAAEEAAKLGLIDFIGVMIPSSALKTIFGKTPAGSALGKLVEKFPVLTTTVGGTLGEIITEAAQTAGEDKIAIKYYNEAVDEYENQKKSMTISGASSIITYGLLAALGVKMRGKHGAEAAVKLPSPPPEVEQMAPNQPVDLVGQSQLRQQGIEADLGRAMANYGKVRDLSTYEDVFSPGTQDTRFAQQAGRLQDDLALEQQYESMARRVTGPEQLKPLSIDQRISAASQMFPEMEQAYQNISQMARRGPTVPPVPTPFRQQTIERTGPVSGTQLDVQAPSPPTNISIPVRREMAKLSKQILAERDPKIRKELQTILTSRLEKLEKLTPSDTTKKPEFKQTVLERTGPVESRPFDVRAPSPPTGFAQVVPRETPELSRRIQERQAEITKVEALVGEASYANPNRAKTAAEYYGRKYGLVVEPEIQEDGTYKLAKVENVEPTDPPVGMQKVAPEIITRETGERVTQKSVDAALTDQLRADLAARKAGSEPKTQTSQDVRRRRVEQSRLIAEGQRTTFKDYSAARDWLDKNSGLVQGEVDGSGKRLVDLRPVESENVEAYNAGGGSVDLYSFTPFLPFHSKWYSQMNVVVQNDIMNWPKMTSSGQILDRLKLLAKQGKFKTEELDDMLRLGGLKEFLQDNKGGKIPRDTFATWLAENQIQVEDRIYSISEGLQPKYQDTSSYNLRGYPNEYVELVLTSPQAEEMYADPGHFVEGSGTKQIGWIRGREFKDINEQKVFLIEEMQSKRHQEGREAGYAEEGVPDAPFRKSSMTLLARRAIRWAAERGIRKIAWTTGEQQAERWGLKQTADYMTYDIDTKRLIGYDAQGGYKWERTIEGNLSDYVGEDFANTLQKAGKVEANWVIAEDILRFRSEEVDHTAYLYSGLTKREAERIVKEISGEYKNLRIEQDPNDLGVAYEPVEVPDNMTLYSNKWPVKIYGREGAYHKSVIGVAMKEAIKPHKAREVMVDGDIDTLVIVDKEKEIREIEEQLESLGHPDYDLVTRQNDLRAEIRHAKFMSSNPLKSISFQPGIELTDEVLNSFAKQPMRLYSWTPFYFFPGNTKKLKGSLKNGLSTDVADKITAAWVDDTISLADKVVSQPWWWAKNNPRLEPIVMAAHNIGHRFTEWFSQSVEVLSSVHKLSKADRKLMWKAMWDVEGKAIPGLRPTAIVVDPKGEASLDPTWYEEYNTWATGQVPANVANQMTEVRRSLDQDHANRWNLAKKAGASNAILDELRENTYGIPNYLPHSRYGDYVIAGYDKDGKKVVDHATDLSMVLDNIPFLGDKINKKRFENSLAPKVIEMLESNPIIKDLSVARWELNKRMDKGTWEVENNAMLYKALDNVVNNAAENLRATGKEGLADAIQKTMPEAVANELKKRSWGHMAERKGLLGYETENMEKVLYDYKAGQYSSLSKMVGAAELGELARGLDKARPNEYDIAQRYIKDVLEPRGSFESVASAFRGLAGFKYLSGNFKTALLNLGTFWIQGGSRLAMDTGPVADKFMAKAIAKAVKKGTRAGELPPWQTQMINELIKDGTIQNQMITEIRAQVGRNPGFEAVLGRVFDVCMAPLMWTERVSRTITAIAAADAAVSGRVTSEKHGIGGTKLDPTDPSAYQAIKNYAEEVVLDSHGLYGKANRPAFARTGRLGKLMSASYTFRSFSHGLVHMYSHMARQGLAGNKNSTYALARAIFSQVALAGAVALPLAATLREMYRELLPKEWKFLEEDPLLYARRRMPEEWKDLMTYGLAGSLGGVGLGESYSLETPDSFDELFGIPAAMMKDFKRAGEAMTVRDWWRVAEHLVPIKLLRSYIQANRLEETGMTTMGGQPINLDGSPEPFKITSEEATLKKFGFQPLRLQSFYDANEITKSLTESVTSKQKTLADRFSVAYRKGDMDGMDKVLAELEDWNSFWGERGMPQNMIDIRDSVETRMVPRQTRRRSRQAVLDLVEEIMQ